MISDTSTIIISWNSLATIAQCLASVFRQKNLPLEVIVVDNASSDGTAGLVVEKFPQVKLIRNQENVRFAKLFLEFLS